MIDRKTWKDFQDAKMLWFVNRLLHVFGWAIVLHVQDGKVIEVYPARVQWRGFTESDETDGFIGLTQHIKENIDSLISETLPGNLRG